MEKEKVTLFTSFDFLLPWDGVKMSPENVSMEP